MTIKLKPTATNATIVILLAIVVVIGIPLAIIWSLNTLFPILEIPYNIKTWLAAFIIPAAFKTNVDFNKDK